MKVVNGVLSDVQSSDIEDGVFTFPSEVVEIGNNAFEYVLELEQIVIPKRVKKIGNFAFSNCIAMEAVVLHDDIEHVGHFAFLDCVLLMSVRWPKKAETINIGTFAGCLYLKNVFIKDGLKNIDAFAFSHCLSISKITFPKTIDTICSGFVNSCKSLSSIVFKRTFKQIKFLPHLVEHSVYGNFKVIGAAQSVFLRSGDNDVMGFGSCCFFQNCTKDLRITDSENKKYKIINSDNIEIIVESEKQIGDTKLYSGIRYSRRESGGAMKKIFLAERDGFFAHGNTLKEACGDLDYKILREKSSNEPIHPGTIITSQLYRAITGACRTGINTWKENNGIKIKKITAGELLPILERTNAYGAQKFKTLLVAEV